MSGSYLHGLGRFIDYHLQKYSQATHCYIKNSFILKQLLITLPPLPPTARLFTADAISLYANIDINDALPRIKKLLIREYNKNPSTHEIKPTQLHRALTIVMRHDIFEFGDTYWFQRTGCAMGTPPACSYATLYFSDHESKATTMLPELIFQKRFIDDLFGIWVPASQQQINHPTDSQRWQLYQQYMNQCGILRWEFSTRQKSVDYLNLTIAINKDGTICTTSLPVPTTFLLPPY